MRPRAGHLNFLVLKFFFLVYDTMTIMLSTCLGALRRSKLKILKKREASSPGVISAHYMFAKIAIVKITSRSFLMSTCCCPFQALERSLQEDSGAGSGREPHLMGSDIVAAAAKSLQLYPTLCNPIDDSPPGSPVPGILQARILEWVAISSSSA